MYSFQENRYQDIHNDATQMIFTKGSLKIICQHQVKRNHAKVRGSIPR